jgi:hypothetical protein
VPIMFKADASDNPNKRLGILAGCAKDSLFTEKTWNSEFCKEIAPKEGDVTVFGKKGLDAFPGTDLEAKYRRTAPTLVLPLAPRRYSERLTLCVPLPQAHRQRHRDGVASGLLDQLLRRVDDAHRVREGLQRRHRHRLLRHHLSRRAQGGDRGHLRHVLDADGCGGGLGCALAARVDGLGCACELSLCNCNQIQCTRPWRCWWGVR